MPQRCRDPPHRRATVRCIREVAEQEVERVAIGDVAIRGVVAQLLLSLGPRPVDAGSPGQQAGPVAVACRQV